MGSLLSLTVESKQFLETGIKYLFDILPGFYCLTFKEDMASEQKLLRKPQVLIAVTKPAQDKSQGATIVERLEQFYAVYTISFMEREGFLMSEGRLRG
jgi:hypothetical protein